MQTFFPDPNIEETAKILDMRRLGKQRVETLQIMKAIADPNYGWQSHPAVNMWRNYPWALLQYQIAICNEWVNNRGYRDSCLDQTKRIYYTIDSEKRNEGVWPSWIGNSDFHEAHQSKLIEKKPEYYIEFWPNVSRNLGYIWPT